MKPLEINPFVFVYGTLKYGYGNWAWALRQEEYIGPASTVEKFLMGNVGFPYIFPKATVDSFVPDELLKPVHGDMFKVSNPETIERLDRLEGEGRHYHRVILETDRGSAWGYVNLDWRDLLHCEACSTTDKGEWEWIG